MITRQTSHRPPPCRAPPVLPALKPLPVPQPILRHKRGRILFFLPLGDLDTTRLLSGMVAVERAPFFLLLISYPLIRMARHWHRWQLRTGILPSSYFHIFGGLYLAFSECFHTGSETE